MTAKQIFSKTQKFIWAKLVLVAIQWVALIVLAGILGAISVAAKSFELMLLFFGIWLGLVRLIRFVAEHYVGYLIKAGHVAVVAKAVQEGNLVESSDMVNVATEEVKSRFVESNVFFGLDTLISGSVKQIQKGLNSFGDLLSKIPGMEMVIKFVSLFIGIFLNYVDECCLGQVFVHKDQNAFKSATDGIVLYFQNFKGLAKSAFKICFMIVGYYAIVGVVAIIMLASIPNQIVAYILVAAVFGITSVIKSSFIDSYIMISLMCTFGEYAKTAEVKTDLYGKFCKISKKFKDLFNKAENEKNEEQVTA